MAYIRPRKPYVVDIFSNPSELAMSLWQQFPVLYPTAKIRLIKCITKDFQLFFDYVGDWRIHSSKNAAAMYDNACEMNRISQKNVDARTKEDSWSDIWD